jgi:hypothetical protein
MHRPIRAILDVTVAAWLAAGATAAAQQVPVPAAPDTGGRVSLVATGGVSAASEASGGAVGVVVTGNLTNRLAFEGAGTFTMAHGGTDSQSLTGSLLFNLVAPTERAIPYLAAGIGMYRSSFDLDEMGFGRFFTQNPGYSGMMALRGGGFGMMQGTNVVSTGPSFDGRGMPHFYAQRMGTLTMGSGNRFGMRSFVDPVFSIGGGAQIVLGQHFVIRPDARALIAVASSDRRTVGIVTLGFGYRF